VWTGHPAHTTTPPLVTITYDMTIYLEVQTPSGDHSCARSIL